MTGCAHVTGYQPTIDTRYDPNAQYLNQDAAECKQLADQASGGVVGTAVQDSIVGAVLGAAAGAVAGAFLGNPGLGAGVGAAAGGLGGAAKGSLESDEVYKRAFRECMRGRGHRVLN